MDILKEEMIKVLKDMRDFLSKSPTDQQIKKSAIIGFAIKDLTKKANELDSLNNLSDVYSSVIADKNKSIESEAALTDIFSKINSAIADGNDAGSGVTKEVIGMESDLNLKKVEGLIKKLS